METNDSKHFFRVTCTVQNSTQLIQTYFSYIKNHQIAKNITQIKTCKLLTVQSSKSSRVRSYHSGIIEDKTRGGLNKMILIFIQIFNCEQHRKYYLATILSRSLSNLN